MKVVTDFFLNLFLPIKTGAKFIQNSPAPEPTGSSGNRSSGNNSELLLGIIIHQSLGFIYEFI